MQIKILKKTRRYKAGEVVYLPPDDAIELVEDGSAEFVVEEPVKKTVKPKPVTKKK